MKTAYLKHFASPYTDSRDQYQTQATEVVHAPLWWQEKGLSYTATGYGKRIPTEWLVKYNGRMRRVYCCIFSNVGTCYIGKLSDGLTVSID